MTYCDIGVGLPDRLLRRSVAGELLVMGRLSSLCPMPLRDESLASRSQS